MPTIKNDFDDLFYASSQQYGVPFSWLKAIAGAESDYNPNAYRAEPQINDGSYGIMQLLYKTATALGYDGDPSGLFDPAVNIDLGARLIQQNISRFGEDFNAVYSAYNSGSPTAYKTNSTVNAHVQRANSYLSAVMQSTAEVTASPDDSGSTDTGSEGSTTIETVATTSIGVIGLLIGVVAFIILKGGK